MQRANLFIFEFRKI